MLIRGFLRTTALALFVLALIPGCPPPAPSNDNDGGNGPNTNANGNTNSNSNGNNNANTNSNANSNTNSNDNTDVGPPRPDDNGNTNDNGDPGDNGNDNGDPGDPGDAPVIGEIPNHTTTAGVPYIGPTPALTAGTKPITWSLSEPPDGMTINADSGVAMWENPVEGQFIVRVIATNSAGSDDELYILTVEAAVVQAVFRISVSAAGEQANNQSDQATISANGKKIAFSSDATNLVPGDTNEIVDIFVTDRESGEIRRVNVGPGNVEADGPSNRPQISRDGNFVVFRSFARNLAAVGDDLRAHIFVADIETGEIDVVSRSNTGEIANGDNDVPAISADGRFVAFISAATNLVANDGNDRADVFVRDRQTGTTTRVSVSSTGEEANGASIDASISPDGRYIAFSSVATNLVANDTNDVSDVFVHDRVTGATTRVSISSDGAQANRASFNPHITGTGGRFVAFVSDASNLAAPDFENRRDVFLHDRFGGATELVSVGQSGTNSANGLCRNPFATPDGRYVAFDSLATNLSPDDSTPSLDVYIRDMSLGTSRLASLSSAGALGDLDSQRPALSDDGTIVVFESKAANLVPSDTNIRTDVFLRDLSIELSSR